MYQRGHSGDSPIHISMLTAYVEGWELSCPGWPQGRGYYRPSFGCWDGDWPLCPRENEEGTLGLSSLALEAESLA